MGDTQKQTAVLAAELNPEQQSTTNPATADRNEAVELLHLGSFTAITSTILKDSRLTYEDACFIHDGLRPFLNSYDGELTAGAFLAWALEAVRLPIEFHAMRRQYGRCVYAGIWSVVRNATDLGYDDDTIPTIESDVWLWTLTDSKRSPLYPNTGTGRVSTRLYGKSRWLARAWKKSQLRKRAKFTNLEKAIEAEDSATFSYSRSAQPLETPYPSETELAEESSESDSGSTQ